MADANPSEIPIYVIRPGLVRDAVAQLLGDKRHPFFAAYLHLRRQSFVQDTMVAIEPRWSELGEFLVTPGGPPDRPFLRPFWNKRRQAQQEWIGDNFAGKYSYASLRSGPPSYVVEVNPDGSYRLRDEHWMQARAHLLYDRPVPSLAAAAFFLRDYGFASGDVPSLAELEAAFKYTFGYDKPHDPKEFDTIFDESWRPAEPLFDILSDTQ